MELKVWVDGIQRIVSGVNDDTTCQDVVIALAHAMGRTGRFTLIEKWREVERPLSANEFPLRVLHKWGEYANEVKFFLCQSDSDKFRRNDKWKKLDRFTHNFSPPVSQTSSVVKRSLTFSGAHNSVQPESSSSSHLTQLQRNCYEPYPNSLSPQSSSQSHSSTSSSVHLSPQQPHCHPHSSASIEFGHSSPKTLPIPSQLIPNSSKFVHDRSAENHQFSSSQEGFSRFQPGVNLAPVELSLDSPHHSRQASLENIEEYNLDQNFPDNLRESGRLERSQGHSEHTEYRLDEHEPNRPESEKCRLLRLVSLQKERLKVQKSELDVIETEIVSLEEKDREYDKDMQKISSDILSVEERQTVIDSELKLLESVEWIEVLQQEQTKGRELQLEISKVKDNLCQCERNINETVSKQKELEDLIQKEKQLVHSLEEENKEKEAKLKNEIKQLQEELDSKEVECENGQRSLSEVMSELNEIETQLEHKHHEADSLEEDLQKINMKEFVNHPPDLTKKSESGQVVLKLLEGRLSPRTVTSTASKTSSTPLSLNTALSAKNPNGVWV